MNKENSIKKIKRNRIRSHWDVFTWVSFIFLLLFSLSLIYLLFWTSITVLKTQDEYRLNKIGLPKKPILTNIKYVIENFKVQITLDDGTPAKVNALGMLINTAMFVLGSALLQTITPCIVAYATTKFNFKFNKVIDTLVLVVMILPIVGSYVSELNVLHQLGLSDTMIGMYILKFNFTGMYYFVFCAAFRMVPKSYYEAAYIDGAKEFPIMTRIAMPMVKYTFLTVFLIQFILYWNDYQTILLYLPSYPTISYGLYELSVTTDQAMNVVPMRMAGCMLVIIPTLVIFLIFSNRLMGNVSLGGLKE